MYNIFSNNIFVLCQDYHQYISFCRENNLNSKDRRIRYLDRLELLRGLNDFKIIYYGTYYRREDWLDLKLEIDYHEFFNNTYKEHNWKTIEAMLLNEVC